MPKKANLKYNLLVCNPTIAHEWNTTKNGNLTPRDVMPNSNIKRWWVCKRGHEWEAVVATRNKGVGCPYCCNSRVNDENSLQTVNPTLAKEWHPTKNGSLTPKDVTKGSSKKVWWQCSNGHEWESAVANRSKGSDCPFCGGKKATDKNCLQTLNPALAKDWNLTKNGSLTPKNVMVGSGKKVWWQCAKGHEWEATVDHRNNGTGCPYCSGMKVNDGNSLQMVNPTLAKEWHPAKNGSLTPKDVTRGSNEKVWWQCSKGHEWEATIYNRNNGRNCPFCGGKKVNDENSLQTVNPTLAKEWHPTKNGSLTPKDVTRGSNEKVWWQCSRSHEWEATVTNRSKGNDCPFCNSQTSQLELRMYTEMKFLFHDAQHRIKIHGVECDVFLPSLNLAIEIDGSYFHKNKYNQDKIKTNVLKKANVELIRIRGKGLSKVSSHDILCKTERIDFNISRSLIEQILSLKPVDSRVRSRIQDYLTKGEFANNEEFIRIWDMLPSPFPELSLKALNPTLAKEWHPTKNGNLTTIDVTAFSNKKVWWQCAKGHEWESTINNRSKGKGCPYCSGRKATDDNSLQALNPALAKGWHPAKNGSLTPRDVTAFSNKKVWWQCSNGHEWETAVTNRSNGSGCPYCYRQKRERL